MPQTAPKTGGGAAKRIAASAVLVALILGVALLGAGLDGCSLGNFGSLPSTQHITRLPAALPPAEDWDWVPTRVFDRTAPAQRRRHAGVEYWIQGTRTISLSGGGHEKRVTVRAVNHSGRVVPSRLLSGWLVLDGVAGGLAETSAAAAAAVCEARPDMPAQPAAPSTAGAAGGEEGTALVFCFRGDRAALDALDLLMIEVDPLTALAFRV